MSNEEPKPSGSQAGPTSHHQDDGKGSPGSGPDTAQGSEKESTQPQTYIENVEATRVHSSRQWKSIFRQAWNWKPKPARYDPDNPPKFTIWLNLLFGFVFYSPPF
jgi:hypothetical protein